MTDEPRDLMAELMASLGIPDEPLDLAVAQPDAPMGETWWRDTARELRDEIERLRTERDAYEDDLLYTMHVRQYALEAAASYVQPGPDGQDDIDRDRLITEWVNEAHDRARERVRPLRPTLDAVESARDVALVQRDALQARIDDAHALLRRWSGGLVPVGDYMLRAETDAALTEEAS